MKNAAVISVTFAIAAALTACSLETSDPNALGLVSSEIVSSQEVAYIETLSEAERVGTVDFLNDGATTFEILDIDCALRRDAARWLIASRPFADIYEAADTKQVGVSNLSQAVGCATDRGYVDGGTMELIEDYNELSAELQAVVDGLIDTAQEEADARCDLPGDPWENGCYMRTFTFRSVEIEIILGVAETYNFRLGRTIDPEGGITESVNYILDSEYNILNDYWDAG